jgi:hypothetical protein
MKTRTGFAVRCPFCHDEEAALSIDLNDVSRCTCCSCDEEFTVEQARRKVAKELAQWENVVRWVEMIYEVIDGPAD